MKAQTHTAPDTASSSLSGLFTDEYGLPFKLLLSIIIFSAIRPDRLIPGGRILTYYPTAVVFFLLIFWVSTPKKFLSSQQTKAFLCFVAMMVLHLPFVRNFGIAWAQVKGFLVFGLTGYLFMIQFIDKYHKFKIYLKLSVGLALIFGILGLAGGGRVNIPILRDENDFSLYMNILIPFAFFFAQEARSKAKKSFWYGSLVVFVLANVASFSRGGFVGLLAVAVYIIKKSKHKISTIALSLVVIAIMALFAPDKYWQEIDTIFSQSTEESTAKQRIESWKAGWHMFMDHPIVGVGPNNYTVYVSEYFQDYEGGYRSAKNMWGRVAHSLYFTLLPELGIIGTFLFVYMLFKNYQSHKYLLNLNYKYSPLIKDLPLSSSEKTGIRERLRFLNFATTAMMGSMIGYLATGIFLSVLYYRYFWNLTALWVIAIHIANQFEDKISEIQTSTIQSEDRD